MHHPVIDETHDPARSSWLPDAQAPDTDFPIQNLPLCVFERHGVASPGIGIGQHIVDLRALLQLDLLPEALRPICAEVVESAGWHPLMQREAACSQALRRAVSALLSLEHGHAAVRAAADGFLVPMAGVRYRLPARIGGYTDFLCSRDHTERHGRLKGLADPLPPAFLSLPVAYNGRPSSLRVGEAATPVPRPWGQWRDATGAVRFAPSQALDFELELGSYVRGGNALGEPVSLERAGELLFGYSLLNDWSAKDIQWWEQVLGPFLGKSFMTCVSPWVVTTEALAPFRAPACARRHDDPPLLPYLFDPTNERYGGLDVTLEAHLITAAEAERGSPGTRLTRTRASTSIWTFAQMVAHHTSNGCNLQAGDLLGSGTLSGSEPEEMACLTEMTQAGRLPLMLAGGEARRWLEDGDTIVLQARAARASFVPIGFGECRGTVRASRAYPATASSPAHQEALP